MTFSAIKNRARISLENRWGSTVGGTALIVLLMCINTAICRLLRVPGIERRLTVELNIALLSVLFLLTALLFFAIAQAGLAWRYALVSREALPTQRVRFWLMPRNCMKLFALRILILILKIMWLSLTLPGGVMLYAAMRTPRTEILRLILFCGGSVCFVTGLFFWLCAIQRYSMCRLLLVLNPKIKVVETVRQSIRQTNGKCLNMVCFRCSFLPWWISCLSVISIVYVIALYTQAMTYYQYRLLLNSSVPKRNSEHYSAPK